MTLPVLTETILVKCIHTLPDGETFRRCEAPGERVVLQCPARRPDAVGGPYCQEHGGTDRAREEAERDWNYLAPASVGGAKAVARAGHNCLLTPDRYIVLRHEPPGGDRRDGTWLAWLGLGSLMVPLANPDAPPRRKARGGRGRKAQPADGPRYAFPTRDAAEQYARAEWRRRLDAHVAEIRASRGGTLDWGLPVEPADEPIVIVAEDERTGWDIAAKLPRQGALGLAVISGLRPSGEVA